MFHRSEAYLSFLVLSATALIGCGGGRPEGGDETGAQPGDSAVVQEGRAETSGAVGSGSGEAADTSKPGAYVDLSPQELRRMLDSEDVFLVNVHVPFAGDIPGTDLSVPFDAIEENQDKLPQDRSAKIVLYCRSGHMSAEAAPTLVSLGYTQVYNLSGGMQAWREAGYEIVGGEKAP